MAPVLLVDSYSLFFRAHHALPPMNTSSGRPTSALYGFSTALLKELREQRPSALAFAVDAPSATFRHDEYADYKAQRERAPEPLVEQFAPLRQLLSAFGVPVFEVRGFEADDVLATLAAELRQREQPTVVLSGDRDLLQLAHGTVSVTFLGARGQPARHYDQAAVSERFGVPAWQLPSWAALVGDRSDNLPGTPGVGPRTAAQWVSRYGNIEQLLAHATELEPARLRAVVLARAEQIRQNERLATLRCDVPLGPLPHVAPLQAAALEAVRAVFRELQFKSLEARLDSLCAGLG